MAGDPQLESSPFGELLREHRLAADLTQEALAERAGLSARGISDLERGARSHPYRETLNLLVSALGLTGAERADFITAARRQGKPVVPADAGGELAPLPLPLNRLIDRQDDLAAVGSLLRESGARIVTLTGPAGVGKTRLALAVAENLTDEFPDGVVFVDLAPLRDQERVLASVASALGLAGQRALPVLETVRRFLAPKRIMLVLDNFEHLLDAAPIVGDVVRAGPGVVTLNTSREPLRVHGEREYVVPTLDLPALGGATPPDELAASPAVRLFVERAVDAESDFRASPENIAIAAAICHRLDGLPLAIELAAPRLKVLPPASLLVRLEQRLPLLTSGPRDAPVRQRTLRDAIAWSYELLAPHEQTLFRRLGVFVGGWSLEAAEWVAGSGLQVTGTATDVPGTSPAPATRHLQPATLDLFASLIDKSLLLPSEANGPESRYEMLETIREFGLERLTESGEAQAIAARHAAWCVRLAEDVWRSGRVSHRRGLAALEAEHPNLRAALTWLLAQGETKAALHLAGELAEFWMRHGHWSEGKAWLERALAADDGEPTAVRVEALVGLTMLLWQRDEFAQAQRLLGEAETVARTAGDAGALAYARLHQGYVALFRGDLDLAVARGEECLATCAAIPQGFNCNGALWLLANATLARGEDERATGLYERLLASGRTGGDEISIVNGHVGLAVLAERRGELAQALAGFAEAAAGCRGFGDRLAASHVVEAAASTAVALGRVEPAARLFAAVDALRAAVGAAPGSLFVINRQRHEQALALARESLGEERFAAEWTIGGALSIDVAVAAATALAQDVSQPSLAHPADGPARLTERERQVLPLLIDGRSDREIGEALFISQRTASNHVSAILRKLGVSTRAEAAVRAVRDGLV